MKYPGNRKLFSFCHAVVTLAKIFAKCLDGYTVIIISGIHTKQMKYYLHASGGRQKDSNTVYNWHNIKT